MRTKTIAVGLVARVTRVSRVDSPINALCVSITSQQVVLSSPYLCVNKVFICDLLRVRFRVSESCGLQEINY